MPTLLDMLLAIPRCRERRVQINGQHGVHFTCYEPMRYIHAAAQWECTVCGAIWTPYELQAA